MNKPVTMEGSTILSKKIDRLDWLSVSNDLDGQGHAVIQHLLLARECEHVRALYECDELFRRRIVMGQHGFGRGEYQYFAYPLPAIIGRLRTSLYPHLAPIANRWNRLMGLATRYPDNHAQF